MKILTVAAHPDDETLGAGATMALHAARGDEVWVLVLTDGVGSRHGKAEQQLACLRRACDVLGVKRLVLGGLPDQRLDTLPLLDVLGPVERCIEELAPDVVLTHFIEDLNQDHRIVSRATMVAARPLPGQPVRRLLCFEVPSSTEWAPPFPGCVFAPDVFVDASTSLATKLAAMSAYADTYLNEVRPWPHPRSLEALEAFARRHGASVGLEAAEAFMQVREIAIEGLTVGGAR